MKLATIIKVTESLNIDVLALQEVRRTGSDCLEFDDESLKGWQFAWSGYNVKKRHGVAVLLAPCVELEDYKEHLKGRILSTTVVIKGVNIAILNGYAPTDEAPIASKQLFYRSLTKAKADLAKSAPSFKLVTLWDFNATI